jgi:hypothetical protein
MLPAQGLGQALGFRCAARETHAAQATPEQQAARVPVMVKIGSKAPANVRTLFPHPPLTQNA